MLLTPSLPDSAYASASASTRATCAASRNAPSSMVSPSAATKVWLLGFMVT